MNSSESRFREYLNKPIDEREFVTIDPEYKEKIVAFVDILGMSEYMRNIDKTTSDAREKYDNINSTSEIFYSIFKNDKRFSRMVISDSFVISTYIDYLSDLIENLSLLQLRFIEETRFFLRGAIAYDNVIDNIEKNKIIGPAFVLAHDLESKIVVYPRIIIDDSIILNKSLKLREDADNFKFIDFLSNITNDDCEIIDKIILKWDSEKIGNKAIIQKRNWFLKYYNEKKQEIK